MEEKERYECKYNEKLMKHYTFDNENKEELGYKGVVRVLNQQNKQIKELNTKLVEEMELSAERRQIIEDLTIENNQQDKEIEELNEKLQDKVADLEAKLAEKEKEIRKKVCDDVIKFMEEDGFDCSDWLDLFNLISGSN